MKDRDYQKLFNEVNKELVTPTMRDKLAVLVEHAGDHLRRERDSSNAERDSLRSQLSTATRELAEARAERDEWKRRAQAHGCDIEKGDPDCG